MNKNVIFQHFEETIPAGSHRTIYFYSRMLTILDNSAGDDIRVGIGSMKPVPLKAGLQYELPQDDDRFDSIQLYNPSGSATTVKLILSQGVVRDNRLTISGTVFEDLLTEQQGDTAHESYGRVTVGVAAVEAIAANTDRKGVGIQSDPDNDDYIYLGYDDTVDTDNWFAKLSAGQAWSRDNYRGPVYAISETADQYIGVDEV